MTDFEHVVICAVRYALGRQTYMVGIVCRYVASVIPTLSENCRNLIIRDIKEAERYGYGHKCDEKDWMELLEKLEKQNDFNYEQ